MKKTKSLLSILLSIMMIVAMIPFHGITVFAADETGPEFVYKIYESQITDANGTMYFSGASLRIRFKVDDEKNYLSHTFEWDQEIIIKGYEVAPDVTRFDLDIPTTIGQIDDVSLTLEEIENLGIIGLPNTLEINTPINVIGIGNGAFAGIKELVSVTLPSNLDFISDPDEQANYLGASAFEDCSMLETVDLGALSVVGVSAFKGCISLKIVEWNKIRVVGNNAFENCRTLENAILPDDIHLVADEAFKGCESIKKANIDAPIIGNSVFEGCEQLEEVHLGESVLTMTNSIGDRVLANCTSLTDVEIREYVKTIGNEAFMGCTHLETFKPVRD